MHTGERSLSEGTLYLYPLTFSSACINRWMGMRIIAVVGFEGLLKSFLRGYGTHGCEMCVRIACID